MEKGNFIVRFIKSIFSSEQEGDRYKPIEDVISKKKLEGYYEISRKDSDKDNGVSAEILYLDIKTLEKMESSSGLCPSDLDEEDGVYYLLLEDYTSYDDRVGDCGLNATVTCTLDSTLHFVGFPVKNYYYVDGSFSHSVPVDVVKDAETYFDVPHLKERILILIKELKEATGVHNIG